MDGSHWSCSNDKEALLGRETAASFTNFTGSFFLTLELCGKREDQRLVYQLYLGVGLVANPSIE